MTPKREAYLAKCSKREKRLRFKIQEFKNDICNEKYRLTQGGHLVEPDNTRCRTRIRQYKHHLSAYRHELNRLKGMDRVVVPRFRGYNCDGIIVGYCTCGNDVNFYEAYCSDCGRRILWERMK